MRRSAIDAMNSLTGTARSLSAEEIAAVPRCQTSMMP